MALGCVGIENFKIKIADQLESYVIQKHFNADTLKIHGLLKDGKLSKIKEEKAIIEF